MGAAVPRKGRQASDHPVVRHDLQGFIFAYLEAAGLTDAAASTPLFRSTVRREKILTGRGMTGHSMCRMFKRRLKDAGLPDHYSPHGARSTTATDLLDQGVALDDGQSYCLLSMLVFGLSGPLNYWGSGGSGRKQVTAIVAVVIGSQLRSCAGRHSPRSLVIQ